LLAVKERARRERRSAGKVLSELARQALSSGPATAASTGPEESYGSQPFPHRGQVVSNARRQQGAPASPL